MRMVKIENLPYNSFAKMRRAILETIPFAIINTEYDKDLNGGTGFFYFWDSDYIPDDWRVYIVQPPANREPVNILMKALMHELREWLRNSEADKPETEQYSHTFGG